MSLQVISEKFYERERHSKDDEAYTDDDINNNFSRMTANDAHALSHIQKKFIW